MKLLKILANILGVGCLCIGILLYVAHDATQNLVSGEVVNLISNQMNSMLISSLESMGVNDTLIEKAEQYLPKGIQDKVNQHIDSDIEAKLDDIKDELINSEELQTISNTYTEALLEGVITGNSVMPDTQQDLKDLSKEYIPKLSSAVNIPISPKQAEQISERMIEKVDLQESLNSVTQGIHMRLSNNQIQGLKIMKWIQGESMQWIALGFLVIGLFLIVIGTQSAVKWTWYVGAAAILCGAFLWLAALMLQGVLADQLQEYGELVRSFSDGLFDTVKDKGTALCILGFGCFGGYGILYNIKKYAKR